MSRYYVTTPIYYVNDAPHIGHAYTTLACDVLARFMRLDGREVRFLTGTDEHGQKVGGSRKRGRPAGIYGRDFTEFPSPGRCDDFSYDDFIRTTEPAISPLSGDLGESQIAIAEQREYIPRQICWLVRGPRRGILYGSRASEGPGGQKLAPTGAEVEWVEEPSYFFRLSDWQDSLLKYYQDNPDFIAPTSRRNEVVSFVEGGLNDLSISRTTFSWGVPVPDDEEHIMYVWLDALTNYITAVGHPNDGDACGNIGLQTSTWLARISCASTRSIGPFSWLPGSSRQSGFAHGWWTNEGQKISKSLGNVIDPFELVDRYGLDPIRYFLLRQVPFGNDGIFPTRRYIVNGDLANDLGNLCQRVVDDLPQL